VFWCTLLDHDEEPGDERLQRWGGHEANNDDEVDIPSTVGRKCGRQCRWFLSWDAGRNPPSCPTQASLGDDHPSPCTTCCWWASTCGAYCKCELRMRCSGVLLHWLDDGSLPSVSSRECSKLPSVSSRECSKLPSVSSRECSKLPSVSSRECSKLHVY